MRALHERRTLMVELAPAGWVRPVNEVSLRISPRESLGVVGESRSAFLFVSTVNFPCATIPLKFSPVPRRIAH
jgi:ABC-type antimicrobial peptide transport system ATPase subunit